MSGRALRGFSTLAAICGALLSCGAGTPVARGFGSRQVLPIRDSTFHFTQNGSSAVDYSTGQGSDGGLSYWTLDLASGQVEPQAPPDGGDRIGCSCTLAQEGDAGTGTFTFTSAQTGQTGSIDDVSAIVQCPCVAGTTATVLRPDATGGLGIFSIDPTTLAVTELVPATLGSAARANGAATETAALASSSLLLTEVDVTPIDGRYTYERTMSDGSTIMFAGTFPAGMASELALFGVAPSTNPHVVQVVYPAPGASPGLVAWQVQNVAPQESSLFVWDDGHQQLVACPSTAPIVEVGVGSADGTKILFGPPTLVDQSVSGVASGGLVPVSLTSGTCTVLSSDTTDAGFSLDGSKMFWLTDQTLWIAAGDGSGARSLGGDVAFPRFVEGTELEFNLGQDLVWVDATDSSNTVHPVAEQALGTFYDLDPANRYGEGPWLVARYGFNTENNTGTLGVIDRDAPTKPKQLISPEVAQYMITGGGPADGGAAAVQIVYLVRGRDPSPQDGVWVATINRADLH